MMISHDFGDTAVHTVGLQVTDTIGQTDSVSDSTVQANDDDFREYGDAPEGLDPPAIAYPSTMTPGAFPTCKCCGPAGWIEHNNFGAHFGHSFDFELEGNAGLCPGCFPTYDDDECYMDGDAGLLIPDSFTIDPTITVVPCQPNCCLGNRC